MWQRAGMDGARTGIDWAAATAAAQALCPGAQPAVLIQLLAAGEVGGLEGWYERADQQDSGNG